MKVFLLDSWKLLTYIGGMKTIILIALFGLTLAGCVVEPVGYQPYYPTQTYYAPYYAPPVVYWGFHGGRYR